MCPFCFLTTVAVVSGSISAGGIGAILTGKARSKIVMNSAGIGHKSQSHKSSSSPPIGETIPRVACQTFFSTDESES
jgi:hypothetical protein